MSIIQSIRDKAAWIVIGAIALALIAFIVQDAFNGRGGGWFSGGSNTLGKVNGTTIDRTEFETRQKTAEDNYAKQGQNVNEQFREQIQESLWNEYVEKAVLDKEFDKLGFIITEKETADILYGDNPPQQLAQAFTDPKTGKYDAQAAYQTLANMKSKQPAQYNNFMTEYVPALQKQRIKEKFSTMISKSYYVPKWLAEKRNADNSQQASINYVSIPYSTIADSTITVSDGDIDKYVADHKKIYTQEKTRGVEYVAFSTNPSADDSVATRDRVQNLRDSFATTNDINNFLVRENSQTPYYESYISRKNIKIESIDTIISRTQGGQIYGPYLDGGSYALARLVGTKIIPDTVKVRHILIATVQRNPQTGETTPIRYDSSAKRLADSIDLAIKGGANFDSLCAKYSDDGTKDKGGIYENVPSGQMVAEFNDFIFTNPIGSKAVVKTEFGYHYVEILGQKGSSPAYKIAYFSQPIEASAATQNAAEQLATAFASESRTKEQFDENVKKKNLNKFNAFDIAPNATYINGIGSCRPLIRWAYNEADLGDVAPQAFLTGDKYVVPVLVSAYEKGTMTAKAARPRVEYKIRNEKKAEQIIQKTGTPASLDAVAKTANTQVQQLDSVQFASGYIPNMGGEVKLIGASFNKANQTKVSDPIVGELGVYFVKVNNISAMPNANLDVKQLQQQMAQQQQQMSGYMILETLKKSADIKDYRYKFF